MTTKTSRCLPLSIKLAACGAAAVTAGYYWLQSERRIAFRGKRVLISGASRGLGLELARLFAREGARLVLLARREDELSEARQEFERQFITASLRSNDWNYCRSARSLGVHRNTLRNKVSHLGIGVADGRNRSVGRSALRRSISKA